ncbi:MAG TPA: XRE family transcriptional regulator, partial [Candidatus Limnocylindrales bacterium]
IDAAERGVAPATLIARDPRLGTIARRPGGGRSPGAPAVDAGTSGDGRSGADGTAPAGGVASLEPADLGTRLRAARRASGLTLRGAAVASRLSPSFISALERSVSGASLAALKRLTSAYGTTVAALASDSAAGTGRLVRTPDRRIVEPGAGIRIEDLATSPTQLESQLFVLSPGTSSEGYYAHPGEEFMFLLDGRLGVWLDEAEYYELGPGDALTFPSTLPHRFRALGAAETRLLWINTPPTF